MLIGEWFIRLLVVYSAVVDSRWSLDDPAHSCWRCYLNDDEGMYLRQPDGSSRPLEKDRIYILPRYMHLRSGCAPRPVRHHYIHFDVVGLPPLTVRELFGQPIGFPDLPPLAERMRAQCAPVKQEPGALLTRQCDVKSLLYELLAVYLRGVPPERRERSLNLASTLEPVQPALQHIDAHLGERIRVPEMAALCCMSEDYFIRQFRRLVGQTPVYYVQRQRVAEAAQRLLFSGASIERIAEETGFGSRYNFTRVFKQHTAMSPAAYRKTAPLYKTPES